MCVKTSDVSNVFQIKRLKELRGMLMETDPCIAVTVRKLVTVSLMEIFKDIVPSYRIRPLTDTEKNTKVRRCVTLNETFSLNSVDVFTTNVQTASFLKAI